MSKLFIELSNITGSDASELHEASNAFKADFTNEKFNA